MSQENLLFFVMALAVIGLLALARHLRLRALERPARQRLAAMVEAGMELPPTLHPVFDPNLCIGSGSCTRVCPLGDEVIGLVLGRGTLIDPTRCIGHGRCAAECPVHAIRLVFGTSERGVDIPMVSPTFETNVPGIYITGELGGMGLIRNAVLQAVEGMEHLGRDLARSPAPLAPPPGLVDVAIVGAGPAGLCAALTARRDGLSYRLLEQEPEVGGSIRHYPRRKLVVTEPVEVPLLGRVHARTISKEELVELWNRAITEQRLKVETGSPVQEVRRDAEGLFTLATPRGEVRARRVMLCVGRRGTPRRLGVPGEDSEQVAYVLRDPDAYRGRRVLVVGGGDSAVEAACTLAEETDAVVDFSYRRGVLSRIKPESRARFEQATAAGRITAHWESEVTRITPGAVQLARQGSEQSLPNDDVLVFAGGDPPTAFLARAGVQLQRHFGEETEEARQADSTAGVFDRIHQQTRARGLLDRHTDGHPVLDRLPWLLGLGGVGLLGGLIWHSGDYFFAPEELQRTAESLRTFRPSGLWGQTHGVLALAFMLVNVAYFVRKEWRIFKNFGSIHTWLQLHVFAGLMAIALTLMHSSLLLQNAFGSALYLSVGLVVLTGVIGRYLYGFVPLDPRGRPLAHAALQSVSERLALEHGGLFERFASTAEIDRVLARREAQDPGSLPRLLLELVTRYPGRYLRLRALLRHARREIGDPQRYQEFRLYCAEMFRLRFRLDYLPHLKNLLGLWRAGHGVLAGFMLVLIAAHVAIAFWLGYRWLFG